MEEEKNDTTVEEPEEETPEEELTAETDWEAEAKKARGIAQRLRTKLTKATEKKVEKPVEPVVKTQTADGLDENALDFLDLKGINDADDIKVIESIIKRTGQSVREVLKDEYVQAKLTANKESRESRAATPSSTKRGGAQGGDTLARAIAKYEQSGMTELPDDFALRSQVIDAFLDKRNSNKPAYLKNL